MRSKRSGGVKAARSNTRAIVLMEKAISGLDAAVRVLQELSESMKLKPLVETMLQKGYWTSSGRTPAATIYSGIIREIASKKNDSRFTETGPGLFAAKA